ncbi:Znf622 [Symbiodinium natans]|uniref:Znf622 protein n=1 Tax=Symbiodinium natans TaxID=878477 RepID=A0A812TR15_9DINO|nr:Znf622 [Symbiodinium natans]
MAMVDFCPPKAMQVPSIVPGDFHCAACCEAFETATDLRAHCKSERHVYNMKRKLSSLKPISQEAWERKLREREVGESTKGTAHLKAGKAHRKPAEASTGGGYPAQSASAVAKDEEEVPAAFSPRQCLFDRQHFTTVEKNLAHMWKTYSFFIPDREYCTDVEGLLAHLWSKCTDEYVCLFCNRRFPDAASTRRHMLDKAHARIGTEARTRRGNLDELGSQELEAELERFYDFTGSTREITERITDPEHRAASVFRYFDEDRDGYLNHEEVSELWKATSTDGSEVSTSMFKAACQQVDADPRRGLSVEALGQLYAEGFADLERHFAVLEELLAKKLASRKAVLQAKRIKQETSKDDANEDEDDEIEDSEEEDGEDDDSSGTEIVECDDEAEFEEVMRILGLQQATVLDNGDLRLPNGMVAANRDVAHIWRQRGTRNGQLVAANGGHVGGKSVRAHLMLANDAAGKVEMTRRQQQREGKRVIAVLREKQKQEMRLGMQMNTALKGKPKKFRTLMGDASGAR